METFTIQPVLWLQHKNTDGSCRLKLCVSIRSKRIYVQTPFRIHPDTWDAFSHRVTGIPNETLVNQMIRYHISSVDRVIRERLAEEKPITARFLNHQNRGATS